MKAIKSELHEIYSETLLHCEIKSQGYEELCHKDIKLLLPLYFEYSEAEIYYYILYGFYIYYIQQSVNHFFNKYIIVQ